MIVIRNSVATVNLSQKRISLHHDYYRCHEHVHCVRKDGDCESGRQGEPSLMKSQEGEMPEQKNDIGELMN